jgi:hypothetical protein
MCKRTKPSKAATLRHGTVAQLRARSDCTFCQFIVAHIDYVIRTMMEDVAAWLRDAKCVPRNSDRDIDLLLQYHTRLAAQIHLPFENHTGTLHEKVDLRVAQLSALESPTSLLVHTTVQSRRVDIVLKDDNSGTDIIKMPRFNMLTEEDFQRYHCHGYILQSADYFGTTFDASRIRTLLEHCVQHHRHQVYPLLGQSEPLKLLLVDVKQGCLVTADVSETYLALSYVWGFTKSLQTLENNLDDLHVKGALFSEIGLARVIRDAMSVVDALGYRYLWVDALCIVQDDASKPFYVDRMDTIYTRALCTIVAAGCADAMQPIPGVHAGSRPPVKSGFCNGRSLVREGIDSGDASAAAPSEHRAWTLQERLVSPRLLVFTQDETFLRCAGETHQESPSQLRYRPDPAYPITFRIPEYDLFHGARGNDSDMYWSTVKRLTEESSDANSDLMMVFPALITAYTKRALTREDDIYNAFMGIQNHITVRSGTAFLWGLPVAGFVFALMWFSPCADSRRRVSVSGGHDDGRELAYPSWAWIAWTGEVKWAYPFGSARPGETLKAFNTFYKCSSTLGPSDIYVWSGGHIKCLGELQKEANRNPRPPCDFIEFESNVALSARFCFAPLDTNRFWGSSPGVELINEGTHCGAIFGIDTSRIDDLKDTALVELIISEIPLEYKGLRPPWDRSYFSELPLVSCLVIKWEGRFAKRIAIAQVIQETWDKVKDGSKKVLLI